MKLTPALSSQNDKGLVPEGSNEELVAEIDILRQELGGLIRELRGFVRRGRDGEFNYLSRHDIFNILEEIVNAE